MIPTRVRSTSTASWLDADENIYLAQFDHMVSKLTRMR